VRDDVSGSGSSSQDDGVSESDQDASEPEEYIETVKSKKPSARGKPVNTKNSRTPMEDHKSAD
jgi:hypothetical protein